MKILAPLNFMPYSKQSAIDLLESQYDWRHYGGKHYESRWTRFFQAYYLPTKLGYDKRKAHLASLVVSGELSRETALLELEKPLYTDNELAEDKSFVAKKTRDRVEELDALVSEPSRYFTEFPNNQAKLDRLHKAIRRFPRAAAITTICDGIAGLLDRQYRLREPPVVIRSVARFQEVPHRESKGTLEIAYSGLIDPIRGLEELVRGVSLAKRTFRVVLRGPVTAEFDQHLMALASSLGIDGRVRIEPPVPFSEIVSACSRSDIGYFVHEDISPQKRFVLPNKFFEYIMAGLALCVSDLPEMARIVHHYDRGMLVPGCEPSHIADALNRLDVDLVTRFRRNTRAAAGVLNWERESIKMVELYGRIAARSASQGSFRQPAQSATRDG